MQSIPHAAFVYRYRTLGVRSSDLTSNVDSGHRGTERRLKVYATRGGRGGSVQFDICRAKEDTAVGVSAGLYFCIRLDSLIGTLWCKGGVVAQ